MAAQWATWFRDTALLSLPLVLRAIFSMNLFRGGKLVRFIQFPRWAGECTCTRRGSTQLGPGSELLAAPSFPRAWKFLAKGLEVILSQQQPREITKQESFTNAFPLLHGRSTGWERIPAAASWAAAKAAFMCAFPQLSSCPGDFTSYLEDCTSYPACPLAGGTVGVVVHVGHKH